MSLAATAAADWKLVAPYVHKALAALAAIQSTQTEQDIEARFPAAAHLAERLAALAPGVGAAIDVADALANYGPLLLEFASVAGIRPMEWGAPNDADAEARVRERDALTNG